MRRDPVGMQHLVECICAEQTERRHYLCTLCCQTVAPRVIIKHVISLDHIHSYFVSPLCHWWRHEPKKTQFGWSLSRKQNQNVSDFVNVMSVLIRAEGMASRYFDIEGMLPDVRLLCQYDPGFCKADGGNPPNCRRGYEGNRKQNVSNASFKGTPS